MKPHLRVTFRPGMSVAPAPHWTDLLRDKSIATDRLAPALDAVLARRGVQVWATREYQARGSGWSSDEAAAGLDRVYRLILREHTRIPPGLVDAIRLIPIVESAAPGAIAEAELPPAQVMQMGADAGRRSRDAISLEEAHALTRGDPSVTVAVLDTGVSLEHPELRDCLLPGHDFVDIISGAGEFIGDFLGADEVPQDEVGHGTHVAGIIAGRGLNMPAGVVPRCKVLPVRVLGAMRRGNRRVGAGLVDNINSAVKWAVDQGVDVINMSLGVRHTDGGLPHQEVVEYASRRGVTIVAAAGNDGQENLYYPGAFESVITVGAVDESDEVAPYSTYGPQVDLVAPGTDIYSTFLDDGYAFSTGTSHAAPFVAGAAALLKSRARAAGRRLSDRQIKHLLHHTADKAGPRFKDRKSGFGRLNLIDALRLLDHKLN